MTTPEHPILQRIRDLWARHRLGIHVLEDKNVPLDAGKFPDKLWRQLQSVPGAEILEALHHDQMPLTSLSLLPAARPMYPWGESVTSHVVGYMVNLDPEGPGAARIIRVAVQNINSTADPRTKQLHFDRSIYDGDEIRRLYTGLSTRSDATQKAAGPDGRQFSEQQLDTLAQEYQKTHRTLRGPAPHNELVAAITADHVTAIVVPDFRPQKDYPYSPVLCKFLGAVAGLQHLQHGIDLPVVIYHALPPRAGKITFLAQGQEALTGVFLQTLQQLHAGNHLTDMWRSFGPCYIFDATAYRHMRDSICDSLGIYMDEAPNAEKILTTLRENVPFPHTRLRMALEQVLGLDSVTAANGGGIRVIPPANAERTGITALNIAFDTLVANAEGSKREGVPHGRMTIATKDGLYIRPGLTECYRDPNVISARVLQHGALLKTALEKGTIPEWVQELKQEQKAARGGGREH